MPVYDLQALGCILDGNPANAANNTNIFQQAIQNAKGNPGPIEIGMGFGLAVLNGQLDLSGANMVVRGLGGMGTVSDWGPTSLIRGFGPGDTLKVSQGGCRVSGLCWQGDSQSAGDAFIKVTETQVELFDHFMDSPQTGILVQAASGSFIGQSWIRNVLIGGMIKYAGVDINNLGGATKLDHVRMFNGAQMDGSDPQPKYGVLVRSAGELIMCGACDIDNCGTNLAIVPGIDGQANTFVQNLDISDCDFDNGNAGQILIQPHGSSFVLNCQLANVWCSSVNNGGGLWPGDGLKIDGSMSHTAMGIPPILNVSVANSVFQNSVQHCGIYANKVQGLSVVGSTAAGNFNGIQTYGCTGTISAVKAGAYVAPPLGQPSGGNKAYGVLLEKSNMKFNPNDNALDGNGIPPGWKIIP